MFLKNETIIKNYYIYYTIILHTKKFHKVYKLCERI